MDINFQNIKARLIQFRLPLIIMTAVIAVGTITLINNVETPVLEENKDEMILLVEEDALETPVESGITAMLAETAQDEIIEEKGDHLDYYESQMASRDFRQTLLVEKNAVLLTINDTEILLSCVEDAETVLKLTVEEMIKEDHQIEAEVVIIDNALSEITFDDQSSEADAELLSIDVVEEVLVKEVTVTSGEILAPLEAVEYITKLKDSPQIYKVVAGDVPSVIAEDNEMNLSELYEYNPELKKDPTKLQIGDELVVMVPKPEISLKITEQGSYNTSIPKGYDHQSDDSYYVGTSKTIKAGSDGVKEVVATVEKVNGTVVSRSIDSERTLQEAVNAVIATGTKALPPKGALGTYISPLAEYSFTSGFGPRWNRSHRGIDLAAPTGTSVRASDGGVVTIAGWKSSYGYLVEIDHGNGVKTRYAHNSKLKVSVGDYVSQYQEIAKVGSTGNSTGPHCHFEIIIEGVHVNPQDYLE